MTGTLRSAKLGPGKAKTDAGLTDGLLPVWMLDRICGKKVVEAVRDDLRPTNPRSRQLKKLLVLSRLSRFGVGTVVWGESAMRGTDESRGSLFGYIEFEARVARGQATIRATTSAAFSAASENFVASASAWQEKFLKEPVTDIEGEGYFL